MVDVKLLENGLKKIIEPLFKGKIFKTYQGGKRSLEIYTGLLPPDSEKKIIPAVTIKVLVGNNSLEEKTIKTLISIGIFNDESQKGYYELLDITQQIFEKIMEKGVIENRFEVTPKGKWELPQIQPHPFFISFIELSFLCEKNYRKDDGLSNKNWLEGGD